MKKINLILIFVLFGTMAVFAQIENPVVWSFAARKKGSNEATIYIKATIENNWHIYALSNKSVPLRTKISYLPSKDFTLIGSPIEPKPISEYSSTLKTTLSYFTKEVVFKQVVKLRKPNTIVKGVVEFTACNDKSCLPADELKFSVVVK